MSRGEEGGEEAGILKPEATGGGESTPDPSEALSDDDADKKKDDSAAKQMLLKAVDRFVEESQARVCLLGDPARTARRARDH